MAKRLRSLASVLWDSESPEDHDEYFGTTNVYNREKELQLDNDRLKVQVSQLLSEVDPMRVRKAEVPHPPNQQSTMAMNNGSCSEPWLCMLRQDVVSLPRLHTEVLPELLGTQYCSGKIIFDIPKSPKATASHVAEHAEGVVRRLSKEHPAVFKVGITSSPVRRWLHPTYGYSLDKRERWQGMKIICVTESSFSAALLECMLIAKFKGTPGCRNEKPGGETASPGEGPHFTYLVYRVLTPPPRIVSHGACA